MKRGDDCSWSRIAFFPGSLRSLFFCLVAKFRFRLKPTTASGVWVRELRNRLETWSVKLPVFLLRGIIIEHIIPFGFDSWKKEKILEPDTTSPTLLITQKKVCRSKEIFASSDTAQLTTICWLTEKEELLVCPLLSAIKFFFMKSKAKSLFRSPRAFPIQLSESFLLVPLHVAAQKLFCLAKVLQLLPRLDSTRFLPYIAKTRNEKKTCLN
jgi:hypothetical protein